MATLSAWRIRHNIGTVYIKSMTWLFVALCVAELEGVLGGLYSILPPVPASSFTGLVLQPLTMLMSLLYLKAGQSFAMTTEEIPTIAKPLDMVIFAAGLVSNPHDIDPLLDKLRLITASSDPSQSFTARQETDMFHVYLQLEEQLVHREPIRNFTREELRRQFDPVLLTKLHEVEKTPS